MNKNQIIKKITEKKEYSQLTKKDLDVVFEHIDKEHLLDMEKVKLARKLLMENYSGFGSKKLLVNREQKPEFILKKHLSTRERFKHYFRLYNKVLDGLGRGISVLDLGCGVNGFSYGFFADKKVNYVGIESIGQFVRATNNYFKKEKIQGKVFHKSLFNLKEVKKIISKSKKPRIVFLFKVIDSLESLERGYSEKLILDLAPVVERFVVSFPTRSMVKREKIWAKRTWFLNFVKKNFDLKHDFELGDERYFVFGGNK